MKKLLSLILAGLMLSSTLVACSTGEDDPGSETKGENQTGNVETEDPAYSLDLDASLSFAKQDVSILSLKNTAFQSEISSEKLGNGVVADSIYERNLAVEERLNVKLSCHVSENVIDDMDRDIQSGLGDFSLVANPTYSIISSTVEGKLLDLNKLDNLHLDKHYWTQGFNDMVTFTENEMQFLVSGTPAVSMYRFAYLTLYNKTLFKDNQLADLYDTVIKGEWTLDKQLAISKDHYVDSDGSGKPSGGDFYGFVTGNCISVDPYMVSTGTYLVSKDPDTFAMMFNSDAVTRLVDVCDKIQLLYNDASTYAYQGSDEDNTTTSHIIKHFAAAKALMATTLFVQMEMNYADLAPLSYGIAPMPKFDTNQREYHSYVQDQVTAFGISAVVGDPTKQEMCAAVLEAMAYFSNKLVRPAYYDTALSERYMQDPQSKEVLDLIFDTLYFDFSSTCCNMLSVQPRDQLRGLLTDTTNTISSTTKSWKKMIEKDMRTINNKLDRLSNREE
jgi:hypothetical protein